MTETNANANAPDDAAQWYAERNADNLRQVESQLNELATFHSQLETTWNTLDEKENAAHDQLDTRTIVAVQTERQRLLNEASKVQNGWNQLQKQKQYLEQHAEPNFSDVLSSSGPQAQLFLRTFKHKLEGDPDALRRLMLADARATAVGLKPGSTHWAKSLEASMGFDPADRSLSDFDDSAEMQQAKNATKRDDKPKVQATEAQKIMARNIPGISEDEYLAQIASPLSQAAQTVSLEPDELNFGNNNKGMDVSFDETPKKAAVDVTKYKPGPNAVTLSPAEVELCEHMAVSTNRPKKDVLKEFAVNKSALHSGKSGHQLYADKMRSEGRY